ncbi:ComF family protein [Sinimarinibacterium sp. CAU 1509]|uniref:ComF family protein n=1 Tax=Sinimarinibacterium sp. CAU 1509 TaxID=2562283 RepID=UPI0010AC706C|nr:ComF family protein [Sinimarinibacterium sp. CAU 1509]TJY58949.1 ComF family protein [Sinimarinibacterium sp. CAU 1509]
MVDLSGPIRALQRTADTVLPRHCQACEAPAGQLGLCAACICALPWNDCACTGCAQPLAQPGVCPDCARRAPPYDHAWAAFRLEAPIQHSIHALKYHADFTQAQLLGTLMAQQRQHLAPLPQVLLPVPLHPGRLRRRGYNQALELARAISKLLQLPVLSDAATRQRATEDQIGQTAAARRRNMRGAFTLRRPLTGLHVALIDDVMTTGATLAELARSCRRAGAAQIEVWAAARTP